MVTLAGTAAAGESVERLTLKPPEPARPPPSRSTQPVMVAPPVARTVVCRVSSLSVGGRSVNWFDAVTPFSVALSVTTVGVVTWPTVKGNCDHACVPCIASDAGTGATEGCELASGIVAPEGGTPAVSCNATIPDAPLYITICSLPSGAIDTGVGGAELMVNWPVVDHAVLALVVGDERPCCESTRQYFGPEVNDSITAVGSVYWLLKASMLVKPGSVATSHRYPIGCGLGTCAQFSVTGSVSVGLPSGDCSCGGGPIGLS